VVKTYKDNAISDLLDTISSNTDDEDESESSITSGNIYSTLA
jgi:hypothetical protein